MAIPRDTTLPWEPERLGTGSICDLYPTTAQPKRRMGFGRQPVECPPDHWAGTASSDECLPDTPCGWCPDCLGLAG